MYTANNRIWCQSKQLQLQMDSKKSSRGPTRNMVFTVTSPTQELKPGNYIEELIQVHTSYQVIPSPLLINYDIEPILLSALPYTKNKLLDITLPLILAEQGATESYYLGRYLLHNQRLVGVKLSSGKKEDSYLNSQFKKWKIGKAAKYKIPKQILDYYKNSSFPQSSYSQEVLVGDFILCMNDIKISLLFESEVEENEQVLFENKRQGCEIFSVVCDLPRQPSFENMFNVSNAKLASKNENLLKRFIKQHNRLLMYSGVRMATAYGIFLSNSFILHPELSEKAIEPFYFNDGVSLSLLCSVEIVKREEVAQARRQKFVENKAKPQLFISYNLYSLKNIETGKSKKFYCDGPKDLSNYTKEHGDLLKKMRLWQIFHSDNQKRPFITSIPLTDKMNEVAQELAKLSQYLTIPMSVFLILYKKHRQYSPSSFQSLLGAEIYQDFDDLVRQCRQEMLRVYVDNEEHYQFLRKKAETNQNVIIYYNFINFNHKNEGRILEKVSKLSDFANFIIRNKVIGYQRILKEARSDLWKLSRDEQLEAVTVYLKNKLRLQANNNSFYRILLQKTKQEIKQCLIEAETSILEQGQPMIPETSLNVSQQGLMADDEGMSVQSEEKQKEFFNKIKEMKKNQTKQMKRAHAKCHKCVCIYEKSMVFKCPSCRTQTCFICVSQTFDREAKSKKEFFDKLKCIVCRKLCNCPSCQGKQKPQIIPLIQNQTKQFEFPQLIQPHVQQKKQDIDNEYRSYCTVCLINGRKPKRLQIKCSTCDRMQCLLCVQSACKTTTFTSLWQCLICKPEVKPQIKETIIDEQDEERVPEPMDIQPNTRDDGPQKKQWNNNNNRNNNFRNQNNRSNNKQNQTRNDERSVSRSNSPVRRQLANKNQPDKNSNRSISRSVSPQRPQNNRNGQKKSPERKRSCSGSATPPRKPNKNAPKSKSRSRSVSKSPPRNISKPAPQQQRQQRSPSGSKTPPRTRNPPAQTQRKRSPSRSGSPVRQAPKANDRNEKKKSASRSNSPPRKVQLKEDKKRSHSRSQSPPKNKKKASISRSNSRSRSRQENNNNDRKPAEKLWGDKPKNNNQGNRDSNQGGYNRDNNQGGYNRDGNQGNRGGYNNRGGDRGSFRGRGRGGFNNNNNRDNNGGGYNNNGGGYNNNNRGNYNNNRNNGYSNNNNNEEENNNNTSNGSNPGIIKTSYESNEDMDY